MNWLEFIASIIGSLAWPMAVTTIFIVVRKPAIKILNNLQRIRYGDMEMDFGKEVEKLEEQARTAGIKIVKPSEDKEPEDKKSKDKESEDKDSSESKIHRLIEKASMLARDAPEISASYAWSAVEHAITQAIIRLKISADYPPYNSALKNISLLEEFGYIDTDTSNIILKMKKLRDSVIHSHTNASVTAREAREFIYLAKSISDNINKLH